MLPTRLHALLYACAFDPWDDWYPAKNVLADYVEEVMGDDARAAKIRELEVVRHGNPHACYYFVRPVVPVKGNWPLTYWREEDAGRQLRRRVLAMFPEVQIPLADATEEQKVKTESQLRRALKFFNPLRLLAPK